MLVVDHISKTFEKDTVNEHAAIRDLSITLQDGDFVTIVGSNGAGKSTLFNAICGSWLTDSGKMMLDDIHKKKISMSDSIYVINPQGYIGSSTWSEICYAWMLGKKIDFMETVSDEKIKETVEEHIKEAEKLAWKQIDYIRHSDGFYSLDDLVHFTYKGKTIVDPWINIETNYNGTPWISHEAPEQAVDPFVYYGKEKVAAFIEEILMLHRE